MDRLMLIVRMAGQTVAISANRAESVVEIESVSPVPLAPPHIAGLAALRSRVVTVIDSHAVLGIKPGLPTLPLVAVVVLVDGHPYGIVVDEVLDVMTADGPPCPLIGSADPNWARIAHGTVVIEDRPHLLVDPHAVIAGQQPVFAAGVH